MSDNNEKKEEQTPEVTKWRQIVIETDGNEVRLAKAEVAGNLELMAALQAVVGYLTSLPQKK